MFHIFNTVTNQFVRGENYHKRERADRACRILNLDHESKRERLEGDGAYLCEFNRLAAIPNYEPPAVYVVRETP